MALDRLEFHDKLLVHCPNCYYKPPSNIKLEYPCIIYYPKAWDILRANDSAYVRHSGYEITVISKNPEDPIPEALVDNFSMASVDNFYVLNNLYHVGLTIYQ